MEMEAALEKFQAKVDALKDEIGADSTETTTLSMVVPEGTYAGEEITVMVDGEGKFRDFLIHFDAILTPF